MLLFLKRFDVIGERPDLGANSLFDPCGALTLDGYSIPIAPNRHIPIAMRCNDRAPVYHFLSTARIGKRPRWDLAICVRSAGGLLRFLASRPSPRPFTP